MQPYSDCENKNLGAVFSRLQTEMADCLVNYLRTTRALCDEMHASKRCAAECGDYRYFGVMLSLKYLCYVRMI